MDFVYLNEIIGRSEYGQLAVGSVSMQDSIMLHLYASPEQRERFLAPLVAGDVYPSVGLTEPEVAGSDPTRMQATAVQNGDEWVINGHKWFTSGASRAAFTTVFAKTDPEARSTCSSARSWCRPTPPATSSSAPFRPWDTSAASIARWSTMTCGCRTRTCSASAARAFSSPEAPRPRPHLPLHALARQAERAFELMCDRALNRYAHGSMLAEKGAIQTMIAESAAEIQAARLMTLDAARAIGRRLGGPGRDQPSSNSTEPRCSTT